MYSYLQGVQHRMAGLRIFYSYMFCFGVAKCDLVIEVEAMFPLP